MKPDKKEKGYYRLRMIYMKQYILHYDKNFKLFQTMGPYKDMDEADEVARSLKENGIINMDTIDVKRVVPYSDQEKF